MAGIAPDEIDFQFLLRQVVKIVDVFERHQESWLTMPEMHGLSRIIDHSSRFSTVNVFPRALWLCLSTLRELQGASRMIRLGNLLDNIIQIASHLLKLDRPSAASTLVSAASPLMLHLSSHDHYFPSHQRDYAFTLLNYAVVAQRIKHTMASAFNEQAVNAWQHVYDKYRSEPDVYYLILAVSLYRADLFGRGHLQESLDYSQQVLLLMRTAPHLSEANNVPVVTWSASGEADVVYSSERAMTRPQGWAFAERALLWNVASSLASLGHYAKARIAATDALSCMEACAAAFRLSRREADDLEYMQRELPTRHRR
ncbi:hypothetical protein HGRIS_014983 [Hohenbuehelia grisea]|uniref:Uncharacterized protein n=1 Tax=Hohenbuehelia grisea TaxID=104357 RepID=A0ABR3JU46_9AGAR